MPESVCADALAGGARRKGAPARHGNMGGWPTAYVLGKIGTELRLVYMPLIEEPLPAHLQRLAAKLPR
jgi:hypothetical protein